MFKLDLNRLEGALGIGALGAAIACFFVSMAMYMVASMGIVDHAQFVGMYLRIAGVICLAAGGGLLVLNALYAQKTESEGLPTWQMLVLFCAIGVTILISLLVPLAY
jgi:hypothetical protein